LLVWWDALLVLDLALNVVDRVGGFNLEGDGLARQGLDKAVAIFRVAVEVYRVSSQDLHLHCKVRCPSAVAWIEIGRCDR
jgi:hypothetical protein